MPPLSSSIDITFSLSNPGVTAAGFGVLGLLSNTGNAWGTPELTRSYGSASDVLVDFAITTPEYEAAAEYFSQQPAPQSLVIGKGSNKPTLIIDLAISSVVLAAAYKVNAYALGVLQQASYTAIASIAWAHSASSRVTGDLITNDTGKLYICITAGVDGNAGGPTGTATDITDGGAHWMYAGAGGVGVTCNDAIAYGLMKSLNALAAPDLAATSALSGAVGSKIVAVTGDAAGNWFALEPIPSGDPAFVSNLMSILDVTTDPGVATDLAAMALANVNWYGVGLLFASAAIVDTPTTGAAAWVEANKKLMVVGSSDTICATAAYALAGSDVANKVKDAAFTRTHVFPHPRAYEWEAFAKMGRWLPTTPGSDNWRMKTYAGVTPVNYTVTQIQNLRDKNAGFYVVLGASANGINVDYGDGKVGSGQYIDVIRFLDWLGANISADFVNLEYNVDKLSFVDDDLAKIENIFRKWLAIGITNKGIAPFPAPKVSTPKAVDIPQGDKTARWLGKTSGQGITASFDLAQAINRLSANVTVVA